MEQKNKQFIYCYLRILTCALHMPQFCSSIPCQHGWIRLLLQFHNSINAVIESGDFGHSSLEVQVAIHQQVKTLLKPAPSLWLTCNFTTVDGSEILQCIKPIENNGRYTTLVWWFQSIWKICSSKWVHLPQSFRVKIKTIFELPPPSGSPYQVVFAGWLNHQRGMSTYGLKGTDAATRGLFFSVRQTWPWRRRSFYWGSTNSASGTMYIVKPIYKKTTIDSRSYISMTFLCICLWNCTFLPFVWSIFPHWNDSWIMDVGFKKLGKRKCCHFSIFLLQPWLLF